MLNTDGSSRGNPGRAVFGGAISEERGFGSWGSMDYSRTARV